MLELTMEDMLAVRRYTPQLPPSFASLDVGFAAGIAALRAMNEYDPTFDSKLLLAKLLKNYPDFANVFFPLTYRTVLPDLLQRRCMTYCAHRNFSSSGYEAKIPILITIQRIGSVREGTTAWHIVPLAHMNKLLDHLHSVQEQSTTMCILCQFPRLKNAQCPLCEYLPKKSKKLESDVYNLTDVLREEE